MLDKKELKEVFPARVWLELTAAGNETNFLERIILEAVAFLLEYIEEIIGHPFYISASLDEGLQILSPAVKNLAADLVKEGFSPLFRIFGNFPDEPKVMVVGGRFGDLIAKSDSGRTSRTADSGFAGASFESYDKAAMRCLGEAVERTCLGFYKKSGLVFGSFRELGEGAINPREFVNFSEEQLKDKKNSRCRFDDDSKFGWAWGHSLIDGRKVLVPAQLVHVPYKYEMGEPIIRLPISTGAAAYTERDEALYRGVCEVIERDAFMIHYLNSLSPPVIDLAASADDDLRKIDKMFKRYNLELYVLDVATDIPVPTFVSLIIDRTGVGPAVTISNKTDLNSKKALIGSIEACTRIRSATRYIRYMQRYQDLTNAKQHEFNVRSIQERLIFWSPREMAEKINFFTRGKRKSFEATLAPEKSGKRLEKVLEYFRKNNLEVIAADLTIPEAKRLDFFTFMVLIPKLQPLYLDERYRYWGGKRLQEVPVKLGYLKKPKSEAEFNQTPQPFA